jgi:uroporphyrinogen decarboxylase
LEGGADLVMILDTAAGELSPETFQAAMSPELATLARAYPKQLGYYAKGLRPSHVDPEFARLWAGLGVDTRWDLAATLREEQRQGFVQGNFDPVALQLSDEPLEREIDRFIEPLRRLDPVARRGWICGLGHGVLPGTPEESVRTFVKRVRETFSADRDV